MMKARKIIPTLFFIVLLGIIPAMVQGTTVTNNYDEKDTSFVGPGWTYHFVQKTTGNIYLQLGQLIGNSHCGIRVREKIHTPTGEDHYHVDLHVHYLAAFEIGGWFLSTFDLIVKLQLLDDGLSMDAEETGLNYADYTGLALNDEYDIYLSPSEELTPNTDYWISYLIYLNFDGYIYMIKASDSEYTCARMDILYFEYDFYS